MKKLRFSLLMPIRFAFLVFCFMRWNCLKKGLKPASLSRGNRKQPDQRLGEEGKPFSTLYREVREKGLIDCVCEACSRKTGVLGYVKAQGLEITDEMKGHPSMEKYIQEGYDILIFWIIPFLGLMKPQKSC